MLNEKNKNKNILKNVRGATVPAALSRRPYPLPHGRLGGCPQVLFHNCPQLLVDNSNCNA
jgi:hypothetical protein